MGEFIKWIILISITLGFWATTLFTFFSLLTIVISGILIGLNDSVIMDLYWFVQMWAPFNFNVILLWVLSLSTAFGFYWIAIKLFSYLRSLLKV